jgi:hypothetical protein
MEPKYLWIELVENIQIQACEFEYFWHSSNSINPFQLILFAIGSYWYPLSSRTTAQIIWTNFSQVFKFKWGFEYFLHTFNSTNILGIIPFAKLPTLIMRNHQNTSHTFYTYSKANSISSSFLQVIVVLIEHLANIKFLISIMHSVLFDFCPTIQMVWIILSPNNHSTLPMT